MREVLLSSAVSARAYKTTLGDFFHSKRIAVGFLLGEMQRWEMVRFDFAVVAASFDTELDAIDCSDLHRQLDEKVPILQQTVAEFQRDILGVWASWDGCLQLRENEILGSIIRFSVKKSSNPYCQRSLIQG